MKRLAFVLGISDYDHRPKLNNAENDARSVAEALRLLKFEVIDLYDCTYETAKNKFYDVLNLLIDEYDAAVFYFAGHGEIINSTDCLIMKDTPVAKSIHDAKPRGNSLTVDNIMKELNCRGNQINILIIDACRVSNDTERGISPKIETSVGKVPYQTFIAFSTSPGDTAKDGMKGDHSPFTKSLLSHIFEENLDIEFLFKKVRNDIKNQGYRQYPWEHTCLVERFCFNQGQMDKYYDLPYAKEAYISSQYESKPNSKESEIIGKLSSTDNSDQKSALKLFISNHSELTETQKFHLGRMIYHKSVNGSYPCIKFLEKTSNLQRMNSGSQNSLLRGIFYEIFFDENDHYRNKPYGDPDSLFRIENLRQALRDKDSENFVLQSLPDGADINGYLLGRTPDYKYNVKLAHTELLDSDWKNILRIEDIRISNKSIFYEIRDNMDNLLIHWSSIRYRLAEHYGLPLQKIKLNPSIATDSYWEFVSLADELPDIQEMLDKLSRNSIPSEIDMLSTLSYIEDVEEYTVSEIYQQEDEITVKGSLEVSVHLEFDGEDEGSMSFPGLFLIKLLKERNEWHLQDNECDLLINTDKYYE